MSTKKLLEEATVRKFMKLANIPALADGFVNKLNEEAEELEEEELEEGGMTSQSGNPYGEKQGTDKL